MDTHCGDHSDIESKNRLQKILNKEIELLDFPHGDYNQGVVDIAKRVGYKHVFTTVPIINSNSMGNFIIGRIAVSPDDWFIEFKLKLRDAYRWLPV